MTPGLFEGFGVELEYMIVGEDLSVLPIADRLLAAAAGEVTEEVERGPLCWSNELVLHVVELKTNGPVPQLAGVDGRFLEGVREANRLLAPLGGRLLPSAMHPWMDPGREMRLWPHGNREIYEAYDRIFDCRGHGWANLQSAHLNLPFRGEEEFSRLHAAIRVVLPLLPALAASSPVVEGRITGFLDTRLEVYRRNQKRIPLVTGEVIPEAVFTPREYQGRILDPMYRQIAPLDPEGILQDEWLNSRGAIPRFERNTIEIRLLDVQETPAADFAVAGLVVGVLRGLTEERWSSLPEQQVIGTAPLSRLLLAAIREGERTVVDDPALLALFRRGPAPLPAGELWRELACEALPEIPSPLRTILEEGPLARRLLRALGEEPSRGRLRDVYAVLAGCLERGEMFHV